MAASTAVVIRVRQWMKAATVILLSAIIAALAAAATASGHASSGSECHRWNCPCAGLVPRRHDHLGVPRVAKRYQQMHAETYLANQKLKNVLGRLVS